MGWQIHDSTTRKDGFGSYVYVFGLYKFCKVRKKGILLGVRMVF
jgi:hypothetical protein